jgi:hypothetical protein
VPPRGEKTRDRGGCVSTHSVFVVDKNGKPLTPTKPAKARKLLRDGKAVKVWSKFGTFGIQMVDEVGNKTPLTTLGVDHGTKFEGYSVVVDYQNPINIKLDLPDKRNICRKIKKRRDRRIGRRHRNCRRRPCRSTNRSRKTFIAPSQKVIIQSRLKIISELIKIYPITIVAVEDVCFNHAKHRWGANFSTIEIGKAKLREFYRNNYINLREFKGYETQKIRKSFDYNKINNKSSDKFEAHCSDSLSLACVVNQGKRIEPGPFLVVDDTYRPVRRQLHYTQFTKGGVRERYSTGTVSSLRKGLLIGTKKRSGRLCGMTKGSFYYHDQNGKRKITKKIKWISSSFIIKKGIND